MKFIIFHGSFGSAQGNWFPQLKEKLESLKQKVILPQFPVDNWDEITKKGKEAKPKNQTLDNWFIFFEKNVLPKIKKEEKLCFIGHSLGPLFILHLVDRFNLQLDCAIFVSPFFEIPETKFWQIDLVNKSFYKKDFDFEKLKKLIPVSYVLYSDNDPYVDKELSLEFAEKLKSSTIWVKRAGHMNSEVNLNEFPLILELCKTRLDLSLYQKYLAYRKELYSVEYVKEKPEGVIILNPKEIIHEGTFHFSNLKKEGFCTFLGWLPFWNPNDKYFKECRLAAKRVKNLIRVFLIKDVKDLRRRLLLKQIELDLKGEVNVYLCWLDKVINKLPELDFGIWDNDYLCIIKYDKNKNWKRMKEVVLDSRHQTVNQAYQWRKIILDNAVRIYNIKEDVEKFIKTK